jgi:hypothetical protein
MTTNSTIPNNIVEAAIRGETQGDHAGKISALEAERAQVKKMLDEQNAFDQRIAHVQGAYGKMVAAFRHDLTPEERVAIDGMYFVIHGGMVDMLKLLPTSK